LTTAVLSLNIQTGFIVHNVGEIMDRNLLQTTGIAALATAVLVAVLFALVDRPVDQAAHALQGGAWFRAGEIISLIADHDWYNLWLLAGFITCGALILGRGPTPGLRALIYVCVAVTIAMFVGETLKWIFGRYRPVMLFEHALYGFSWFAWAENQHSFPSGHTMRIFSFMTALSLVWPKIRAPLLAVAGLVGIARVVVTRHYPSDVVAGAFVGIFCALWVWRIVQVKGGNRAA